MLKAEGDDWDLAISKVVLNYNNCVHSVTKISPSQNILTRSHQVAARLPVSAKDLQSWREAHPNFCPFKVGSKVVRKIPKIGNLLKDK